MIILAATVILTISKNNPVESSKEARFKEDIRTFQDELALSIAKDNAEKQLNRNDKFNVITFDEMKNYIPSMKKEYEGKLVIKNDELMYQEDVVGKEKKWFEDLGIRENIKTAAEKVYENTSYYGKNITNYSANGVSDWKIFHSDGKNLYLIASDYVDLDKLPSPLNGGSKPENTNASYPKAAPFDNVLAGYEGSSNITEEKIKALNNDYFSKGYISINPNMKAVAYMLDTTIWSDFAGEKAEYAIGGPTVEMLLESYSKSYNVDYRAQAFSNLGYKLSNDGGKSWKAGIGGLFNTRDSLYVIKSTTNALAMWMASPSTYNTNYVMYVGFMRKHRQLLWSWCHGF